VNISDQMSARTTADANRVYVFFLAAVAALGGFLFGFDTAVISGALSPLIAYFNLADTPVFQGWLVSSVVLGSVAGALTSGYLADKAGRKSMLCWSAVFFLVSSLGAAMTTSFPVFIAFRLLAGVAVGMTAMVSPLYIAEIAPVDQRGRMVALNQFALTIGILAAYLSNEAIGRSLASSSGWLRAISGQTEVWRIMLGIVALPSAVFVLLLLLVPESPRFLIRTGRPERALQVLSRLNGAEPARTELAAISRTLTAATDTASALFRPPYRKRIFIALFLAIASQLTGIDLVLHYGPLILERAGFSFADSLGGQLVFGIVLVVFTLLAMWKVDSLGRRPLLFAGNTGIVISLLFIGYFFREASFSAFGLLAAISCFVACFAFSMGPIPWIVMSEIFPSTVRSQAMAFSTFALFGANWLIAQFFPVSLEAIGGSGTFFLLALLALPTFLFISRVLPETKGTSLEESVTDC
jgi:SP family arabinose:H+ symporter-like MFS transporter